MLFPALPDAAYVLDIAANLTRDTLRREEKLDGKVVSGTSGRSETIPGGSESTLAKALGVIHPVVQFRPPFSDWFTS